MGVRAFHSELLHYWAHMGRYTVGQPAHLDVGSTPTGCCASSTPLSGPRRGRSGRCETHEAAWMGRPGSGLADRRRRGQMVSTLSQSGTPPRTSAPRRKPGTPTDGPQARVDLSPVATPSRTSPAVGPPPGPLAGHPPAEARKRAAGAWRRSSRHWMAKRRRGRRASPTTLSQTGGIRMAGARKYAASGARGSDRYAGRAACPGKLGEEPRGPEGRA